MIQEVDLLNHIHEGSDMGIESLKHIISLSDDAGFIKTLNTQVEEYQKISKSAAEMLCEKGEEPAKAKPIAKMMSYVSSDMKTMTDRSPSKLAEIVIQGSTMGTTNLTKQMHEYCGENEAIVNLAKKELKIEENNIEEMKKYL